MSDTMLLSADSVSECSALFAGRARRRCMFVMTALAGIAIGGSPVGARTSQIEEPELARCIYEASEGKPWLERTLWGLRDQEAGWLGAEIHNKNGSHDLGPLQINSWWVPRLANATGKPLAHIRWWLINDPCFNVAAAKWIFLSGLTVTKDYWTAVGAYHSPTAWRRQRYALGMASKLRRRFGQGVFASPSHRHFRASRDASQGEASSRAKY